MTLQTKTYHDADGIECNLYQLVRREPEWAANRIKEGEKDTKRLDWLLSNVSGKALREMGVTYSAGADSMRKAIDAAMRSDRIKEYRRKQPIEELERKWKKAQGRWSNRYWAAEWLDLAAVRAKEMLAKMEWDDEP